MKTKIIILLIILINLVFSFNEENNNENTNENEIDFAKEPNPYLVLGVPPWTKFQDIKKRYKKITEQMKRKNELNSIKYKRYQTAFEQIKNIHKKNNYKDQTFFDVVKTTITNIFLYEFIIFAILSLSWAIYTFNTFAALLVATFISVDNVIPHWFPNVLYQYIFSFFLTLVIYFRKYFLSGKKNEDKNEDDNSNSNNDEQKGKKRRRRFEKIE